MHSASEVLRNTLDTLRLDPDAREDRRYLITVLRRLGYSEEEIREAVGEVFEPVQPEMDEERVVEVEYMASTAGGEFERVVRGHPRAAAAAPLEESWDVEDMDDGQDDVAFVEVEPTPVRFDEPRRLRMQVVHAETPEEAEQAVRSRGLDTVRAFPISVSRHQDGAVTHEQAAAWDAPDEDAEWDDAKPQSDAAGTTDDARWQSEESSTAWPDEGDWSDDEGWESPPPWPEQVSDRETTRAAPKGADAGAPSDDDPFEYKGYTLHSRDIELSTGKDQRIYFFAKGTPRSGEPTSLPEGYEVRENERTGLPFLARQED